MTNAIVGIVLVAILVLYVGNQIVRNRRRAELSEKEFPKAWVAILERNVVLYRHMPKKYRDQLHDYILIFLDEKEFEGAGGFEITDEVRVTVAGQACMLMLNRPATHFPKLCSVVMYPSTFGAAEGQRLPSGEISERPVMRLGESWTQGTVVLAWDSVLQGSTLINDGQNVVIHEFAHQLDQEDGVADGAPILETNASYGPWSEVLSGEFEELQEDAQKHVRHVMNYYGATNPAEFFAVATETFFEKPQHLQRKHPELYQELRKYYKLDPVAWMEGREEEDDEAESQASRDAKAGYRRKAHNPKKLRRRQKKARKAREAKKVREGKKGRKA